MKKPMVFEGIVAIFINGHRLPIAQLMERL